MTKKVKRRRKVQKERRQINWALIGVVVFLGVAGLFALLFVALQGGGALAGNSASGSDDFLENFCASNEENCIEQGSPDAEVTFLEISDYGCIHCRNFNLEKADALHAQYVESGQVKWVVMPYALRGQGGQFPTLPSAVSAMCANEQDRFQEYHKAMFQLQGTPLFNTEAGFVQAGESLGLDMDAFASCLQDNDYADIIMRNISVANSAGISTTPTFFIGGRKVEGNLPNLSDFQQVIESALGS